MAYKFVAPDNGVLSLIYEREENVEVRHITSDHYFLNPVSATFQGRDIFAPVAGWLSKWVEADKFGEPISDYTKFTSPKPKWVADNLIKGVVLKIDIHAHRHAKHRFCGAPLQGSVVKQSAQPRPLAWARLGRPFGARGESMQRPSRVRVETPPFQNHNEKYGLFL